MEENTQEVHVNEGDCDCDEDCCDMAGSMVRAFMWPIAFAASVIAITTCYYEVQQQRTDATLKLAQMTIETMDKCLEREVEAQKQGHQLTCNVSLPRQ